MAMIENRLCVATRMKLNTYSILEMLLIVAHTVEFGSNVAYVESSIVEIADICPNSQRLTKSLLPIERFKVS